MLRVVPHCTGVVPKFGNTNNLLIGNNLIRNSSSTLTRGHRHDNHEGFGMFPVP